jgi:hypothetical protein
MAIENISQDLSDLLATKNFEVKYTDAKGQDSSPEEAKVFAFDWVASSGKNYGTVVIVLGDDNDFQVFFGDNLGKTMEDPEDKLDWFGSERHTGFLEELSRFAIGRRYNFSPKNINQLKHTMQGMAAIKEGLFEGYYGTRHISYMGERTEARLMIKHNRMIGEDDKRYRYVESLFIETADGERFRLPFTKLTGGRAMLEHVRQGGKPYDIRGQHINEVVTEMAVLSRFNRASHGRVFEGITEELVESVTVYYQDLQENLKHMATTRGYAKYFESWTPADIGESTALVEDLKTLFIEQTLDARIEAALPTLAKIQHRGRAMKEAQIFENWVNNLAEGTWALPDTPEAQSKLDELMSKELIVGPDATNATEQLYDIIGDDELFDILHDLAENDPRANIWDDTDVQARLQELGIQMNTTSAADQQQPVAPAAGQQAPGTAPEQAVREGSEPTEKVSDVIKRVMGDILIFEPGVSKLYKNTRRSRTQRVDDYKMELIGVEDPAVEKGKGYFSARDGHPLAKKLKRALIQAGYPVYDDLLIFPNGIMFQVRTPITTTAEQAVREGSEPTEKVSAVIKRVLGDKLLWGRRISQLIKSPRANFDRYQILHIRVYDDFGPDELNPIPFSANEGQPLAKKLKRELIKAGYPVSSDLIIYPEAIMFNVRKPTTTAEQGVAEAIVGKPRYSEPHQSGRGFYSAADYMVRTNHQLGSHAYTAVTQVDGDNDRYYFIYQKGNKEPVFYATDMGQFEVRTDKLGNRISNAIMTAHREATDHDLEKYMSGDDESEWDQEKNMAEGLNEMDKSQDPPGRDGGHQFPPGPKVSKKVIKAVEKDPAKHLQDLFAKEYSKKKVKEQGVAEGNELGQLLKHAGVLVKESMLTDSTGETLDHILNRFKNEVKRFQNGDEIDTELYYALFDYYNDHGEMPYGVAKARDGDPVNWISDKLTAELGIDENLIAAQSMPVTTESSSCNMTTEGEYCPEHGLAECGYMEDMAPVVMDEAPQDAINYNAAVTGAYYESKEGDALLARIKSLALLK